MAGDWIKWQKGLTRKPEVLRIAATLGRSRHEVAALLCEVWEWADDNATVRFLSGFDPDKCPGIVRVGSEPGALLDLMFGVPGLSSAIEAAGWFRIEGEEVIFPNFGRHNGTTAKSRALDASRKATSRNRPGSVREMSGSEPDKTRNREEKRREEKKNTSAAAKPPTAGESEPVPKSLAVVEPERPRPRNELFDAIAEVCGVDPKTSGSSVGKAATTLAKASPAYTPDDVREFGRRYPELCAWAKGYPSPSELEKYIGRIRAPTKAIRPHSRGAAQDDYALGLLFNSAKGGDGVATEVDF
jgi:hypothetical protein